MAHLCCVVYKVWKPTRKLFSFFFSPHTYSLSISFSLSFLVSRSMRYHHTVLFLLLLLFVWCTGCLFKSLNNFSFHNNLQCFSLEIFLLLVVVVVANNCSRSFVLRLYSHYWYCKWMKCIAPWWSTYRHKFTRIYYFIGAKKKTTQYTPFFFSSL